MPWYGAIVWAQAADGQRVCCQRDYKRGGWEFPKGGAETRFRRSSGWPDTSYWSTARWEFWEEAGVCLGWREEGQYYWVSQQGQRLPRGPEHGQSAFVVTGLQEQDVIQNHPARTWLNRAQCEAALRRDHHRISNALGFEWP